MKRLITSIGVFLAVGALVAFYLLNRTSSIDLLVKIQFEGAILVDRSLTYGSISNIVHGNRVACIPQGKTETFSYMLLGSETLSGNPEQISSTWVSIADAGWNGNDLKIYDGANKLIAVPDDITFEDAVRTRCSVNFHFKEFIPPKGPIIIKPPHSNSGTWTFSQTEVKTKVISLNPGNIDW